MISMLDQTEVSLRVLSHIVTLDDVIALLGAPSYSHRKGDPVSRLSTVLRGESAWILEFPGEPGQLSDRLGATTLFALSRHRELDLLRSQCTVDICCALYEKKIVPVTLKGRGQSGYGEPALGDGKARGSECVG